MNDIIAVHKADLVDAVTEAVKPLKIRIATLEGLADARLDHITILDDRIKDLEGVVARKSALINRLVEELRKRNEAAKAGGG